MGAGRALRFLREVDAINTRRRGALVDLVADAVGGARARSPRFAQPGRVVIGLWKGTALEEALDGDLVRETFSEAGAGCSATLLSNASFFAPLARGIVGGWSSRRRQCCQRGLGLVQGAPRLRFASRVRRER